LLKHVWMVWGGWGDAEKSYESVSVKFELFGHEKSQENHSHAQLAGHLLLGSC